MRSSVLLSLIFESTHSATHFHFRIFGGLCKREQHELHPERLAHILELLFRSLLVRSSKRFCLASEHVGLPICSKDCERVLPP